MSDIVERLRFDAVRCELQFSKGVAGNIEEAAAEIERLRAALAPFAEPHAMGDNYVQFAPRLIEAARAALADNQQTAAEK